MPITTETIEFLAENRLRDSREWFHENHDRYTRVVREPLCALAEELTDTVRGIDPLIVTQPVKVISRINRDIRFSKDKSLYRDVLWLVFHRSKEIMDRGPGFYFEFSPRGWEYGCGFYTAGTDLMEILRQMILEDHKDYRAAQRAYGRQDVFTMGGETYKRPRYADQPPKKREWLERRNLFFSHASDDFDQLYSENLAGTLGEGFTLLAPVYRLLCTACERQIFRQVN